MDPISDVPNITIPNTGIGDIQVRNNGIRFIPMLGTRNKRDIGVKDIGNTYVADTGVWFENPSLSVPAFKLSLPKLNSLIVPDFKTSLLAFSSIPTGTSFNGKFGIEDNISSSLFLIKDCSLLIDKIFSEISFDFANKDLS